MDANQLYEDMCAILGDMIFKMHKWGIPITNDSILQQLIIMYEDDNPANDPVFFQAMIRIFLDDVPPTLKKDK